MKIPFLGIYVTDFWGDGVVQRMPRLAQCAHLVLLTAAWQERAVLHDPEECLESYGFERDLWKHIQKAWSETPDGWVQKRLTLEWEKAMNRMEGGKKGGEAKAAARLLQPAHKAPSRLLRGANKEPATINANANATTNANPNPYTTPSGDGASAPKAKRGKSRKPTVAQCRALVAQHLALQAIPGFADAIVAWREALTAKRVWASTQALTLRLRWLEKNAPDALELVEIAAANGWTDPRYAVETLAALRAEPGSNPRYQKPENAYLK